MKSKPEHNRRSVRLQGWSYSDSGLYFITICSKNRECIFGEIVEGKMILNDLGKAAEQMWNEIPQHHSQVCLDSFVVMPNHVHGILVIENGDPVGACHGMPLRHGMPLPLPLRTFGKPVSKSLSVIINQFKGAVT